MTEKAKEVEETIIEFLYSLTHYYCDHEQLGTTDKLACSKKIRSAITVNDAMGSVDETYPADFYHRILNIYLKLYES